MTQCYRNPDNPEMTHGNVVMAIRDHDAEKLPERQRWPRAVTEDELCGYVEGIYLGAMHDRFKEHPERKKMEVRCENKREAEYLRQLINRRCADPTNRFEVAYPAASSHTPRSFKGLSVGTIFNLMTLLLLGGFNLWAGLTMMTRNSDVLAGNRSGSGEFLGGVVFACIGVWLLVLAIRSAVRAMS